VIAESTPSRRQKRLPPGNIPEICALDPDGDILRTLLRTGRARRSPAWACYHTDLYVFEQGGLRLGVQGGGCSGLSYNIRFDTQPRERDRIFQFSDVRVFVDPKSFIYLHGMILDYQETLMQQGFVFVNPQATKSCGCGTSFSA